MTQKINTGGRANGLGGILKDLRQKARRDYFICSALKKVANMTRDELYDFLSTPNDAFQNVIVHPDYIPVEQGIVIPPSRPRNRLKAIENLNLVCCNSDLLNEIADRCHNGLVLGEVLRIDQINYPENGVKKIEDIKKDLSLKATSPDKLIERILFFYEEGVECNTMLGFWEQWVVTMAPPSPESEPCRLRISALNLKGLIGSCHIAY
jgi:hypothetical protein